MFTFLTAAIEFKNSFGKAKSPSRSDLCRTVQSDAGKKISLASEKFFRRAFWKNFSSMESDLWRKSFHCSGLRIPSSSSDENSAGNPDGNPDRNPAGNPWASKFERVPNTPNRYFDRGTQSGHTSASDDRLRQTLSRRRSRTKIENR